MTWSEDRGRLSHDILANQITNELMTLEMNPSGETIRLNQFIQRENEFRCLLAGAPEALSEASIIDWPIFNVWDSQYRAEIRQVVHALFITKSGLNETLKDLEKNLKECLEGTRRFLDFPDDRRTSDQVISLRKKFDLLRMGISLLPPSYMKE